MNLMNNIIEWTYEIFFKKYSSKNNISKNII